MEKNISQLLFSPFASLSCSLSIRAETAPCERDPEGNPEQDSQEQTLQRSGLGHDSEEPAEGDARGAVYLSTVQSQEDPAPQGQV